MVAVALRQGWARQKVAGWWWLLRHTAEVRQRRSVVQSARTHGDAEVVHLLTGDFAPGAETGLTAPPVVRWGSRTYWHAVKRSLGGSRPL
jgi:hypothetical protein